MKQYAFEKQIGGEDLKLYRQYLHLTQKELSVLAGVDPKTVERWEKPGTKISGPIAPLIRILMEKEGLMAQFEIPEQKLPLRMKYYYRTQLCTIADVDEMRGRVEVVNYTDRIQFRAFGVRTEVSVDDFHLFLESRCMPSGRDKLELELNERGIPFYDPLLIIEKTQGRMAEDDFWIELEWKRKENG